MWNPTLRLLIAALFAVMGANAAAKESVIGLSPHLPPPEKEALIRTVVAYLGATLERGETAYIVDAHRLTRIGAITAPDRDGFDSLKARIKANREAVRGLKSYAAEDTGDVSGLIDLAAFLRHVGATYPARSDRELIVVGSPLSHDPRSPDFSMRDQAAVPTDSHLLASRSETPYGASNDVDRLANYRGHFGLAGPDWTVSDAHAFAVERFTALSFLVRSARFAGVAVDAASAFRNAMEADLPEAEIEPVPSEELLMIRHKAEARAEAAEEPAIMAAASIYERPLSSTPPSADRLARAEAAEVAIRWSACESCDLDLAVWPEGAVGPIDFRNPNAPEGRLIKDHRSSPAANGWEQIVFSAPIDLRALVVAVNFYAGASPGGAVGEIRIAIEGETWGRSFRIPAGQGNGGDGRQRTFAAGAPANRAWIVVDPLAVTGG